MAGKTLVVGISALVVGIGLGSVLGRAWVAPPPAQEELARVLERQEAKLDVLDGRLREASRPGRCAVSLPPGAVDAMALRAQIAQVLREELRSAAGGRPDDPPPERPEEPSRDSLEAQADSLRLIDGAVATQRWGEAEATKLRSLMPRMTPEQRREVMSRLTVALNRGELILQTPGEPF